MPMSNGVYFARSYSSCYHATYIYSHYQEIQPVNSALIVLFDDAMNGILVFDCASSLLNLVLRTTPSNC